MRLKTGWTSSLFAQLRRLPSASLAGQRGEAGVGKAHGSSACADSRRRAAGRARGCGPPWRRCLRSARGTTGRSCTCACTSSSEVPRRIACATMRSRSGVGVPSAARMALRSSIAALAEAGDLDLVEAGEAGLQAAQRLLQRFLEGAADRHHLADRLHGGGQHRLGAGEFLEGEARDLGDDIVDRRLEARPASRRR